MIPLNNNFTLYFDFDSAVPAVQLKDTLVLATMAAETLFGPERVALESCVEHDAGGHRVGVFAPTEVGRSLAVMFLGFCRREFGSKAVRISRAGVGNSGVKTGGSL